MSQSACSKVLVNVVTGAQGAGKTALIANLLREGAADERVVVLMNKDGDVGLSADQMGTRLCALSRLSTGCICCTASSDFAAQVLRLIEECRPHRLIVETSDHAEPSRVLAAFYQSEKLAGLISIEPTICVIDADRFREHLESARVRFLSQLQTSAVLVLNKTDLLDPSRREEVRAEIAALNPRAWIQECARGAVPVSVIFMRRPQPTGVATPEETGYSCFAYEGGQAVLDRGQLERLLKRMPPELFRVQGVVRTEDGTYRLNYVTGHYELEPAPADDASSLVFVGRGLNKGRLCSLLDRCRVAPASV